MSHEGVIELIEIYDAGVRSYIGYSLISDQSALISDSLTIIPVPALPVHTAIVIAEDLAPWHIPNQIRAQVCQTFRELNWYFWREIIRLCRPLRMVSG
jgi:hypothetical protein